MSTKTRLEQRITLALASDEVDCTAIEILCAQTESAIIDADQTVASLKERALDIAAVVGV